MSLFGFDAYQNWERAESELVFWFCVLLFGPLLLFLILVLLANLLGSPRIGGRMR
jgi:hypothetical protein